MTDNILNTQFEQFTKLQSEALENLKAKGTAAADYFEKSARYQQTLVADAVDFAVSQARLATTAEDPTDYVGKQIEAASSYSKVVADRTSEYVDLLSSAAASARKGSGKTAKKAAGAAK